MSDPAIPLKDAWTGGQYSVVRFAAAGPLALALAWQGVTTGFDPAFLLLAVASALVAVGVGSGERILAGILALAASFNVATDITSAANQYAAAWLSLHLLLPRAPYLSLAARGRADPRGGWTMPWWFPANTVALLVVARLVAGGHAYYDGHTVLAGLFALTALLVIPRETALAGWALSLGLGLGLAATGHGNLSSAWLLHVVAFQPAWIARRGGGDAGTVFYDGSCALCHGAVRFLLAEDKAGSFRFAPLGGPAFRERVPETTRRGLPDSVVVVRGSTVLTRGDAVAAVLDDLGGIWVLIAAGIRATPRTLVDRVYDFLAEGRYRWFGRKTEACPVLPTDLRDRFDAGKDGY